MRVIAFIFEHIVNGFTIDVFVMLLGLILMERNGAARTVTVMSMGVMSQRVSMDTWELFIFIHVVVVIVNVLMNDWLVMNSNRFMVHNWHVMGRNLVGMARVMGFKLGEFFESVMSNVCMCIKHTIMVISIKSFIPIHHCTVSPRLLTVSVWVDMLVWHTGTVMSMMDMVVWCAVFTQPCLIGTMKAITTWVLFVVVLRQRVKVFVFDRICDGMRSNMCWSLSVMHIALVWVFVFMMGMNLSRSVVNTRPFRRMIDMIDMTFMGECVLLVVGISDIAVGISDIVAVVDDMAFRREVVNLSSGNPSDVVVAGTRMPICEGRGWGWGFRWRSGWGEDGTYHCGVGRLPMPRWKGQQRRKQIMLKTLYSDVVLIG